MNGHGTMMHIHRGEEYNGGGEDGKRHDNLMMELENDGDEDSARWHMHDHGGTKYEGEWHDGKMHGHGKMEYPDGSKYEGNWQNGKMNGRGKMEYPDGSKYEGNWEDGKRSGEGKMHFTDGSAYKGNWEDDRPRVGTHQDDASRGKGTTYAKDGREYTGEHVYISDYTGEHDEHDSSESRPGHPEKTYAGLYKDGKPEGFGIMKYADGGEYHGEWHDGARSGKGRMEL